MVCFQLSVVANVVVTNSFYVLPHGNTFCFQSIWSGEALQGYRMCVRSTWASLVAYVVKNPPATQETWVQSLGWEDPLEEGTATHSRILA